MASAPPDPKRARGADEGKEGSFSGTAAAPGAAATAVAASGAAAGAGGDAGSGMHFLPFFSSAFAGGMFGPCLLRSGLRQSSPSLINRGVHVSFAVTVPLQARTVPICSQLDSFFAF